MKLEEEDFFKNGEPTNFITSDFYLSAFLLAQGYKIIATKWVSPERLGFEFDNKENINKLVDDFVLGKTEVNTRSFINGIRCVKDIILQAKFSDRTPK